jgi:hypothetical protein
MCLAEERPSALKAGSCQARLKDCELKTTRALAAILAASLHATLGHAQAIDPTAGFSRLFGLGGHACKQYDDTGRLYIYAEGLPSISVVSWLQRSDNGTRSNVPMPQELADALPLIPGCLPGKHHA